MSLAYSCLSLPGIPFPPPSTISSPGWWVYSTHPQGRTRSSPSPISALGDHRVKDRQEVSLPERTVLLWWGEEGYLLTPSVFFLLGSTTSTFPSPMDAHTTEGKQEGLLSQQISEKT